MSPKAEFQDATLTGVDATFYTQDDDKDSDTFLECWINMSGERERLMQASQVWGMRTGVRTLCT
jgi:hypothetical protein